MLAVQTFPPPNRGLRFYYHAQDGIGGVFQQIAAAMATAQKRIQSEQSLKTPDQKQRRIGSATTDLSSKTTATGCGVDRI